MGEIKPSGPGVELRLAVVNWGLTNGPDKLNTPYMSVRRCWILQGLQTLVGSAQEDRKLMDSVEKEAGRLREDLMRLSADNMPAENGSGLGKSNQPLK
ncbi:hypothetical protein PCANC_21575 [Puccinia coronata f. sp. avenae]|uniref:Uncharacterized protein n=1 Tax=Puccinia coronata f. sp. avenae TaxID=200324 RepID=A0A2N5U8Y7_9BASI|nr:hypothetical protein PCANC_21575 [Puccinia coronata f. sp. avenae]